MGAGSTKDRTQHIAYQRDLLGACWNSPYGAEEATQFLPSRWMGLSKTVMELHTGNQCFVLRSTRIEDGADAQQQNTQLTEDARAAAMESGHGHGDAAGTSRSNDSDDGHTLRHGSMAAPHSAVSTKNESFASFGGGTRLRRQMQPSSAQSPAVGKGRTMPTSRHTSVRDLASMVSDTASNHGAEARPKRDLVHTKPKSLNSRRRAGDTVLQTALRDTTELERVAHSAHPYLAEHGLSVFPGVTFRAAPARRRYDRVCFVPTPVQVVGRYMRHVHGLAGGSSVPPATPSTARGTAADNGADRHPLPRASTLAGAVSGDSDMDDGAPLRTPPRQVAHRDPSTGPRFSLRLDPSAAVAVHVQRRSPLNPANNYPIEDVDHPRVNATTPPIVVGSITAAELLGLPANAEICLGGWMYISLEDEQQRLRKSLAAYKEQRAKRPARTYSASHQPFSSRSTTRMNPLGGLDATVTASTSRTSEPSQVKWAVANSPFTPYSPDRSGGGSRRRSAASAGELPPPAVQGPASPVDGSTRGAKASTTTAGSDGVLPKSAAQQNPARGGAATGAPPPPVAMRRSPTSPLTRRSQPQPQPNHHYTTSMPREDAELETWVPHAYIFIALPMYECAIHPSSFHLSLQRTKPISFNLENPLSRHTFGVGCLTAIRYGGVMVIECRDRVTAADEDWVLYLVALAEECARQEAAGKPSAPRQPDSGSGSDGDDGGYEPEADWRGLLIDPTQFTTTFHQRQRVDQVQVIKRRIRRRLKRQGLYVVSASTRAAAHRRREARRCVQMEMSGRRSPRRGDANGGDVESSDSDNDRGQNSDDAEEDRSILKELGERRRRQKEQKKARAGGARRQEGRRRLSNDDSDGARGRAAAYLPSSDSDDDDGVVTDHASDCSANSYHRKATNERAFYRQRPQRMMRGTFRQLGGMRYLDATSLMEGCPVSEVVRGVEQWIQNLLAVPVKARPLSLFLQRYEGIATALRAADNRLSATTTDTAAGVLLNNMSFNAAGAALPNASFGSAAGGGGGLMLPAGPAPQQPGSPIGREPRGGGSFAFSPASASPAAASVGLTGSFPIVGAGGVNSMDSVTGVRPNNAALRNGSFASLGANLSICGGGGGAGAAGVLSRVSLPYLTAYAGPLDPNIRAVLPPAIEELIQRELDAASPLESAPSPPPPPPVTTGAAAYVQPKVLSCAAMTPCAITTANGSAHFTAVVKGPAGSASPGGPLSPDGGAAATSPPPLTLPQPTDPEDSDPLTTTSGEACHGTTTVRHALTGVVDGMVAALEAETIVMANEASSRSAGMTTTGAASGFSRSNASPKPEMGALETASAATIENALIGHGTGGGGGDAASAAAPSGAFAYLLAQHSPAAPLSVVNESVAATFGPAAAATANSLLASPAHDYPLGVLSQGSEDSGAAWAEADRQLRKEKAELDEVHFLLANARTELQEKMEEFITVGSLFMPHTRADQIKLNMIFLKMLRHFPEEVPVKELRADWLPTMLALLTTTHEDLFSKDATGVVSANLPNAVDLADVCDANSRQPPLPDDADAWMTRYCIEAFPPIPQVLRTVQGLPPAALLREIAVAPLPYRINPETARVLERLGIDSGLSFVFTGGSLGVLAGTLMYYTDFVKRRFKEELARLRDGAESGSPEGMQNTTVSNTNVIDAAATAARSAYDLLEQTRTVLLQRITVWGATEGKKGVKTLDQWREMHEAYYSMLDPSTTSGNAAGAGGPGYLLSKFIAATTGRAPGEAVDLAAGGRGGATSGAFTTTRSKVIMREMESHAERVGIPFRASECFALFDAIAYYLATLDSLEEKFSGRSQPQKPKRRRSLLKPFQKKSAAGNGGNVSMANGDSSAFEASVSSPPEGPATGLQHPLKTGPFEIVVASNYYYKAQDEQRHQPQLLPLAMLPSPVAGAGAGTTTPRQLASGGAYNGGAPITQGDVSGSTRSEAGLFPFLPDRSMSARETATPETAGVSDAASNSMSGGRRGPSSVPPSPCIMPATATPNARVNGRGERSDEAGWRRLLRAGTQGPTAAAARPEKRKGFGPFRIGPSGSLPFCSAAGDSQTDRRQEPPKGNGSLAGCEEPYCGGEERPPPPLHEKLRKDSKKLFRFLDENLEKWKRQSESNGGVAAAYAKRIRVVYS